jgi:hypothetical protein
MASSARSSIIFFWLAKWLSLFGLYCFVWFAIVFLGMKLGWI